MTLVIFYVAGAFFTYWLSKLIDDKDTVYPYDHTPWVILWPLTLCLTLVSLVILFFEWVKQEIKERG